MKILIVKMSSLGDLIHTFPVVQYLKQNYPFAEIDWVVERPFAELVMAHPLVNQVYCVETKKWRKIPFKKHFRNEISQFRRDLRKKNYDLVLDLQGNIKSALVTMCAKSARKVGFGYSTVPEWPNILATHKRFDPPQGRNIREDYLFLAQSAVQDFTPVQESGIQLKLTEPENQLLKQVLKTILKFDGLKVMVCPGSNWPNKQLSQETLRSFLQCFAAQLNTHFLFLWGHKGEKEFAEELSLTFPQKSSVIERVSLPTLQNLMGEVDLVIAMDSLPLHLAGTTATPSFSIFGASSAHKYKPAGTQHEAYQGSCPYGQSFNKRCEILRTCKTGACVKGLEGRQIFDYFFRWWQKSHMECCDLSQLS